MSDELYPLELCAKKADVSLATIKRDIAAGKLRPTRIRGCVKVHPRDWEEYLQKCRSVSTEKASRSAFSIPGKGLADLLGVARMLPNLSATSGTGSQIVELAAHRHTRSRKRSKGG